MLSIFSNTLCLHSVYHQHPQLYSAVIIDSGKFLILTTWSVLRKLFCCPCMANLCPLLLAQPYLGFLLFFFFRNQSFIVFLSPTAQPGHKVTRSNFFKKNLQSLAGETLGGSRTLRTDSLTEQKYCNRNGT